LAIARRALLWGREVTSSGTWGCGYARPTPRIQYTASSFAQPAVEFFAPLYRWRQTLVPPSGLFPQSARLATSSGDLAKELLYWPLFSSIGWALSKLRWLQHGRVHVYILYVGCTIVALMVWYASVVIGPGEPEAPRASVQAVE
jgi:hydrogenase-4 component B